MYQYNMNFCCFIGWSWDGRLIEKVVILYYSSGQRKSPDISGPFPITFSTHAPGVSLPTASCSGACVSWHSLDSRGSLDVWEKTVPRIPGNAALGFAPSVRHKVSRPAGGRQPETIGTARNRKCSAHRHIPRHRPAGGSFRHSNYNTHA